MAFGWKRKAAIEALALVNQQRSSANWTAYAAEAKAAAAFLRVNGLVPATQYWWTRCSTDSASTAGKRMLADDLARCLGYDDALQWAKRAREMTLSDYMHHFERAVFVAGLFGNFVQADDVAPAPTGEHGH